MFFFLRHETLQSARLGLAVNFRAFSRIEVTGSRSTFCSDAKVLSLLAVSEPALTSLMTPTEDFRRRQPPILPRIASSPPPSFVSFACFRVIPISALLGDPTWNPWNAIHPPALPFSPPFLRPCLIRAESKGFQQSVYPLLSLLVDFCASVFLFSPKSAFQIGSLLTQFNLVKLV